MNSKSATVLAGVFLLGIFLAGRGVAREIAAPFQELDRMAKIRAIAVVAPEPMAIVPPEPEIESAAVEEQPITNELAFERTGETVTDPTVLSEAQVAMLATWDQWRKRAIEELPENLREYSEHRRAVDSTYREAIAGFLAPHQVEAQVMVAQEQVLLADLNNLPPAGGLESGGVGFTDVPADQLAVEAAFYESYALRVVEERAESSKVFIAGEAVRKTKRRLGEFVLRSAKE